MHSLVRSMSADTSRLNLKTFYLNRYIRMTPTMMFLIFFSTTVLRYLGNGPEWLGSTVMFDHWCRNRWFLNLFYVHNFIQTENMVIISIISIYLLHLIKLTLLVSVFKPFLVFSSRYAILSHITIIGHLAHSKTMVRNDFDFTHSFWLNNHHQYNDLC